MQAEQFHKIQKAVSTPRLDVYRHNGTGRFDTVCMYLWNQRLCESLYTVLQNLEVTLRNSMHDAATSYFSSDLWFDRCGLLDREQDAVANAKNELRIQKKPVEPGRVVAELGFGFWAGLLRSEYDRKLWPSPFVSAFPYVSAKRSTVSGVIQDIRKLRNRVFHHERITRHYDLKKQHQNMLNVMGWINPEMRDLVVVNDHFPHVYKYGRLEVARKLREAFPVADFSI